MRINSLPETDVAEGLEALLAEMRRTADGIAKPQALVEAERFLMAARDARASHWETYQRRANDVPAGRLARGDAADRIILAAKAVVDDWDREIHRRQGAVDRLRDKWHQAITAAVAPFRDLAGTMVTAAAEIIAATNAVAGPAHRKLPPATVYSRPIEALRADMSLARYALQERVEAELDRQIVAAARPLRQPDPATPRGGGKRIDATASAGSAPKPVGFRVDPAPVVPMMPATPAPGRMNFTDYKEAALSIFGGRK